MSTKKPGIFQISIILLMSAKEIYCKIHAILGILV